MTVLAFIDTETTTLGHLAHPWETAVILRDTNQLQTPGYADGHYLWQVEYRPSTLPNGTDPDSLNIGGWRERAWGLSGDHYRESLDHEGVFTAFGPEWTIARSINKRLQGATLVGVGTHFDAAVLSAMFRRHGLNEQPWHYAIHDLKSMTYGAAVARGLQPGLPMNSEELANLVGVEPAPLADRHTAWGDAKWAARWWDTLHASPAEPDLDDADYGQPISPAF